MRNQFPKKILTRKISMAHLKKEYPAWFQRKRCWFEWDAEAL